ncbi:hypothetical protein ABVF61_03010 [Roseibium sp. HPY-6]|uniref:hypothetical protein n=1 Tax=Roseibium sp. HPY-6 TaxID=3229852 RepID=UPI00338F7351
MSSLNSNTGEKLAGEKLGEIQPVTVTVWTDWSRDTQKDSTPVKAYQLRSVATAGSVRGNPFQ